jgi:D-alanyl-D-alanine carboxypeptidase/Putative peptidoglycan binding domain
MADLMAAFGKPCKQGDFVAVEVFGKTIPFQRRGANQLLRAAMKAYLVDYEVFRIESFNCRKTTSGTSWSAHAWAGAVDINPETNPFTSGKLVSDMPKAFVNAFTSEGFGWGGAWKTVKDAMHFSLSPNEGGKPKIEKFDPKLQQEATAAWLARNQGVNLEAAGPKRKRKGEKAPPFPGVDLDREHNARKVDAGVKAFQAQLITRGWDLEATGKFDKKTEQVVRAFQREKKLFVDGVVGENTWRQIWEADVT